jgi:hypothetical protein
MQLHMQPHASKGQKPCLCVFQTLVGLKRARLMSDSEQQQSWGVLRVYSDGTAAAPASSPSATASNDRTHLRTGALAKPVLLLPWADTAHCFPTR